MGGIIIYKTIEKLEKAKEDIMYEFDRYGATYDFPEEYTYEVDNQNFRNARLIIKKVSKEAGIKLQSFIKECRTIDEAVECLVSEAANSNVPDSTMKNYIGRHFNEFIDYIEEEQIDVQIMHVKAKVPQELTYQIILESIEKCERRIEIGDYSGAVTSAKTLVEGVCKEILENFPEVEIKKNISLISLFGKVRDNLSLDPGDPKMDNALKEVITGLNKIVGGISEVRNSYGDSHLSTNKIKEHHALVVVNSAKTVVNFLFGTYSYQLERGTLLVKQ
jgi:Abortive infection C-terminus